MKNKITQAVILAGGMGTRLRPFTETMPKAMYPVGNIPFIERLVLQVKSFGIKKVVILLGYMADKITSYLGDGSKYGIEIKYDITPVEYDTGDRLRHAKKMLHKRFMLMYCDNYLPIDFNKVVNDAFINDASIQLYVYNNNDNYTKSNVRIEGENNKVTLYDKTHKEPNLSGVEVGYSIVKKDVLNLLAGENRNFSTIFPKLVEEGKLFATTTEHRYYSIGSFERMKLTEEFFKDKKVVFLDRDGTLNVRAPKACYIETEEQFVWLPGAIEAVKLLNDNGFITILITNQPGIARGNLTEDDLKRINNKMQNDLKKAGAKIDYIYYCPHNWDEGCSCRKPKPGMLYQAQKDLSLDLTKCMLFGDDERDIEAANNARCKSVLVSNEYPLLKAVKDYLKGVKK